MSDHPSGIAAFRVATSREELVAAIAELPDEELDRLRDFLRLLPRRRVLVRREDAPRWPHGLCLTCAYVVNIETGAGHGNRCAGPRFAEPEARRLAGDR